MHYCIHGLPLGTCATCRAFAPNPTTDHGLFHGTPISMPLQFYPGCICPPTSEQTCKNPACPRRDHSRPLSAKGVDILTAFHAKDHVWSENEIWDEAIEACVRKVEAAPLFEVSSDVTPDERTTILDILRKHIRLLLRQA